MKVMMNRYSWRSGSKCEGRASPLALRRARSGQAGGQGGTQLLQKGVEHLIQRRKIRTLQSRMSTASSELEPVLVDPHLDTARREGARQESLASAVARQRELLALPRDELFDSMLCLSLKRSEGAIAHARVSFDGAGMDRPAGQAIRRASTTTRYLRPPSY